MISMPSGVRSEFVTSHGLRTHYLRAGASGPPVVLLHGSAIDSSRLTYGPSIPAFADAFAVYAPDWPGYGRSQATTAPSDFAFYSTFVQEFLDALDLPRVHLAGFSMGGGAALEFALQFPERVESLTLIDAYGLGMRLHVPFAPYLALRFPMVDTLTWAALRREKNLLKWFLKGFVFANPRLVTNELVDAVHQEVMAPGIEDSFMAWLRDEIKPTSLRSSYHARLKDLRVPTLLLHGTRDLIIPASRARRAAMVIPNAKLELVRRCGHWLPQEARDTFQTKFLAFLKASSGQG